MKIWYDTEFFENGPGKPIIPISIGMVSEDGRELYLEVAISPFEQLEREFFEGLPEWHRQNVLPHLQHYNRVCGCSFDSRGHLSEAGVSDACPLVNREEARSAILAFAGSEKPELWGYYADYDHVVLCQIFGTMMDLPANWPMYTRDIKQYAVSLGNPKIPKAPEQEHHALADARWNKWAWELLHDQEAARAAS